MQLWEFDKLLHEADPGVVQPFFDWSSEWKSVTTGETFGNDRYGAGTTVPKARLGDGAPIRGGLFEGFKSSIPKLHLVKRNIDKYRELASQEAVKDLVRIQGFSTFAYVGFTVCILPSLRGIPFPFGTATGHITILTMIICYCSSTQQLSFDRYWRLSICV